MFNLLFVIRQLFARACRIESQNNWLLRRQHWRIQTVQTFYIVLLKNEKCSLYVKSR